MKATLTQRLEIILEKQRALNEEMNAVRRQTPFADGAYNVNVRTDEAMNEARRCLQASVMWTRVSECKHEFKDGACHKCALVDPQRELIPQ